VRDDGAELLSRLDEGGLAHYYVQGPGTGTMPAARAIFDAAWWTMRSTARSQLSYPPVSVLLLFISVPEAPWMRSL
jgi:hypothetical protein